MRISLEWIRRLLGVEALGIGPEDLAERLTLHVAEVEGIERTGPELDGVVVGAVTACEPHPDADRLRVCTVEVGGGKPLTVVCGAPNVAAGQRVPVATVGTRLRKPTADGAVEEMTVKRCKLRGVASAGMICAEDELGLGPDHSGIMVLDGDPRPGTPLTELLGPGDAVLLIDNHAINHRPDLWGHLGWAREIAAVLNLPPPPSCDLSWDDADPGLTVRIEAPERCHAYAGAVVAGVDNRPSPAWLQDLLTAAGSRPHGLLVDVTNFVMLELGEPMHAFDRRQIAGDSLLVRPAAAGEAFTTLDGAKHVLGSDDLLIADRQRGLALAGIMGGENSMVGDDTDTVVLEAACFQAAGIRRTRQSIGEGTESSNRFEKGLYPEMCPAAINRAIELLREAIPDCTVAGRLHDGSLAGPDVDVDHDPGLVSRRLGIEIPPERQRDLLAKLGFAVAGGTCPVPWWRRKDVGRPIDLAEEVGRLHGYERIADDLPQVRLRRPARNLQRDAEGRLRRILSAIGWDEVMTHVFTDDRWAEALGWDAAVIRPRNPLASDQTVMRRSLLPALVEAAVRNRRHLDEVHLYEIGKIYGPGIGDGDAEHERTVIAGVCCAAGEDAPFYAARDAAHRIFRALGVEVSTAMAEGDPVPFVAGRTAVFRHRNRDRGLAGEFSQAIRELAGGGEERLAGFELELERLVAECGAPQPVAYRPPSRFQATDREFTFVADEELPFADLKAAIVDAAGPLCRRLELVTIYRGDPIPAGEKAVSLRVRFQADDRSLGDKDLRKLSAKVVDAVAKRTGAVLRT